MSLDGSNCRNRSFITANVGCKKNLRQYISFCTWAEATGQIFKVHWSLRQKKVWFPIGFTAVSLLGRDFENLFQDWNREVIFPRALWQLQRPASCHSATWCSPQSAQGYPHGDVHWVGALGTGSTREQRASRGKEAPTRNTSEMPPFAIHSTIIFL